MLKVSSLYPIPALIIFLLSSRLAMADLNINGFGLYREFGVPFYAVRLETTNQQNDLQGLMTDKMPKTLSVRVLAENISPRQWCRFWTQNISINLNSTEMERFADELLEICESVHANLEVGDLFSFSRESENSTVLKFNGYTLDTLTTPGIFESVLLPFVGNSPVSIDLKAGLLRQSTSAAEAAVAFNNTLTQTQRQSLGKVWFSPPKAPEIAQFAGESPEFGATADEDLQYSLSEDHAQTWSPALPTDQTNSYEKLETPRNPLFVNALYMPSKMSLEENPTTRGSQLANPLEKLERVSLIDIQRYQIQSLNRVYTNLSYPMAAQRRGREGSLRLMVQIDAQGNVHQVDPMEISNYEDLNKAAMRAIEKSEPFEAPPLASDEEFFELLLPIRFELE